MLKKYLLALILIFVIFGCKNTISKEGVLIYRSDLPFEGYNEGRIDQNIFLKTSESDADFPDGIRYYVVCPKDTYYQDFINNMGRKVRVKGENKLSISTRDYYIEGDFVPRDDVYYGSRTYWLDNAKIIKVLD